MKDLTIVREGAETFFTICENNERFNNFIEEFHKKSGISVIFLKKEVRKFYMYWTEPTKNGKKQRWQTEKTFEVKRRLIRWLDNAHEWSKKEGGKYKAELI